MLAEVEKEIPSEKSQLKKTPHETEIEVTLRDRADGNQQLYYREYIQDLE